MDALIAAAARCLAAGDPLGALQRVALRDDPPALALRGIAMAQLGELPRARTLLRRAARGFGPQEAVARARCAVAEAEVALALRELASPPRALALAHATLARHGEHGNALQARLIELRRLLLLGRLGDARAMVATLAPQGLPAALQAMAALAEAELALRSLRPAAARVALAQARQAAAQSRVPALQAEVAAAAAVLDRPAARLLQAGHEQPLRLDAVAALLDTDALVVDACRHALRAGPAVLPLARRPVLFTLARTLAEAWPAAADRSALILTAFRLRDPDETHRARLRVQIGRLRALAAPWARIEATEHGFALRPLAGRTVAVLAPPLEGEAGALLALLDDGQAWSTSALALALGESQRQVQRLLAPLQQDGRVRSTGRGRAQRWLAPPLAGFATILLLPSTLPAG